MNALRSFFGRQADVALVALVVGVLMVLFVPIPRALLDFLIDKGLDAPFSCREGNCSACACRVLEGEVTMVHNEVLDDEDLADGIRLACQSLPVSDTVRISYQ